MITGSIFMPGRYCWGAY